MPIQRVDCSFCLYDRQFVESERVIWAAMLRGAAPFLFGSLGAKEQRSFAEMAVDFVNRFHELVVSLLSLRILLGQIK